MSPDLNPIDQYFQQKLGQAKAGPPPGLWDKIEAQLPAERKQRPAGWLWAGGVALAVIGVAVTYQYALKSAAGQEKVAAIKTDAKTENETTNPEISGAYQEATVSTGQSQAASPDSQQSVTESGVLDNPKGSNSSNSGTRSIGEPSTTASVVRLHSNSNIQLTPSRNQQNEKPTSITAAPLLEENEMQRVVLNSPLAKIEKAFAEAMVPPRIGGHKPGIDCPLGERRPKTWVVEGHASVDWPLSSFGGSSNVLANRLDSMSTPLTGYSAGLRLGRELGRGFWLYGGFQYSRLRQSFTSVSENERRQIQVITIRTIVRSPGDTLRVSDTSNVWQIGTVTTKSINMQQMIDLPLLLSYQTQGEGLQFAVTAGPVMNFRTWYNGLQIDNSNNVVPLKTTQLRRSLGLGAIAMVQVIYPVSNGLSLWAAPHFRYNFRDYTLEQAGYHARNHQLGLQMGLRYQLNNRR